MLLLHSVDYRSVFEEAIIQDERIERSGLSLIRKPNRGDRAPNKKQKAFRKEERRKNY